MFLHTTLYQYAELWRWSWRLIWGLWPNARSRHSLRTGETI